MYRPVFDIQKPGQLRNVIERAERVNAETPWVIGFSMDNDQTELHLTASLKKPVSRAFEIRLEPLAPHTNYTEEREFKEKRASEMKHLADYLQGILDTEKTRDQHIHLDRACENDKNNIALAARTLTTHAAYSATLTYTGDKEYLTLNIRQECSSQLEPLMQLVVGLTPPEYVSDAESLAFKKNRNARLSEILQLLTDLDNPTRKVSI